MSAVTLGMVLLFLHLVAAAFWLGGLILLAVVVVVGLRTLDREAFRRLIRGTGRAFAVGSAFAWALLALTGFLLARQHLDSVAQLTTTSFGRRLTVKIGLAGIALVAAAAHTITGRSRSRPVLVASRVLALVTFLATVAVYYQATQLGV